MFMTGKCKNYTAGCINKSWSCVCVGAGGGGGGSGNSLPSASIAQMGERHRQAVKVTQKRE